MEYSAPKKKKCALKLEKENIVILKQDKGRGVVIMNRSDYIKKCDDFLATDNFQKLNSNPTKSFQSKVQRTLNSMKNKFDKNVYKKLYPSSSQPGLFFGLAKIHKMQLNDKNVDNLPIRPVISNIGTATYQTSKYLAELLKPLAKSKYTMDSTDNFLERIKSVRVDNRYDMVSFDVVSLFTNVPIEYTIDVILDKVFNKRLIKTKLSKTELKKLLLLCTTELHFKFNKQELLRTCGELTMN